MNKNLKTQKEKLIQLLTQWKSGLLTEKDIHEEAELMLDSFELKEALKSDPYSLIKEVLRGLSLLNHELAIVEDIPAILEFLQASPGKELEAWEKWNQYWDSIDFDERAKNLANHGYYIV